jgi:signal transduction histidine kinase
MHNETNEPSSAPSRNEGMDKESGTNVAGNGPADRILAADDSRHLPRAIVHDMRNAVAPIRNAVYLLRLRGRDDPTLEQIAEMIDRQVKEIVRMLNESAQTDNAGAG